MVQNIYSVLDNFEGNIMICIITAVLWGNTKWSYFDYLSPLDIDRIFMKLPFNTSR